MSKQALFGHKAFLVGFPLSHSLSPIIHNYWLKLYKKTGLYMAIEKAEAASWYSFLENFPKEGYCGGNVTLPFKELAYNFVEKKDAAAKAIGAVNMLWYDKGEVYGGNSDAYGFIKNLEQSCKNWQGKTALVLGAGGAARAVLYALCEKKIARIFLVNRTKAKSAQLVERFGREKIQAVDWEKRNFYVKDADFLINTTPLTMKGFETKISEELIDLENAKSSVIVHDLVYNPLKTSLLKQAQGLNLSYRDGLDMLLYQAVPAFEHWFGIRPAVDHALRNEVLQYLKEET